MENSVRDSLIRDNPWLIEPERTASWLDRHVPEPFLSRRHLELARARWSSEPNRAHLLIGPRQAGKSTAIWAHLNEQGRPALFIDCEQQVVRDWCRSPPLVLEDLESLVAEPVTLFFDEVQHLEEAGLFFKGLVDRRPGVPLLVTGSSSYHLGSRVRESLAGRASRSRLFPFAIDEVCSDLEGLSPTVRHKLREERFARHMVFGGYPAVWLSDTPKVQLLDLVESIILRDASDLFRIERPDAFRRLLGLLAGQAGNLINVAEWASILGVSRPTVDSYLAILQESHVAVLLAPYVGGKRAELTSRPKVFLIDNGIRNQILLDYQPLDQRTDSGATLENWVFTELWKVLPQGATLHFWRSTSGAEVDFVIAWGPKLIGIEVKTARWRQPKLPRASRSFIDAYQPAAFFVVNLGIDSTQTLGPTSLRWLHPMELATALEEAFQP